MLTSPALTDAPGVAHAFFTRQDGVSGGIYRSLNCGFGSGDDPARVAANRARAMERLGLPAPALVTVHQVHSPDVVTVETPWAPAAAPKADALVTTRPGVALGILTADCAPILLVDAEARVAGAAHAGWRGAVTGVAEATVAAMERLGARRGRIRAAIGPCIGADSYEVGAEFPAPFLAQNPAAERHFSPGRRPGKLQFDLSGYVADRLGRLGLGAVDRLDRDTCTEEERFFSYRRACLRGEPDYGRFLSAVALAP